MRLTPNAAATTNETMPALRSAPSPLLGPIATLGWLHHGLSSVARGAAVDALAPGPRATDTYGEWMVRVWLREPGLGPGWTAWAGGDPLSS